MENTKTNLMTSKEQIKLLIENLRNNVIDEESFSKLLDFAFDTDDGDIISEIDLLLYNTIKKGDMLGYCKALLEHKNYSYKKIGGMTYTFSLLFQNSHYSYGIFSFLILKNGNKYRSELTKIIDNSSFSIIKDDFSIEERTKIFCKIVGLTSSCVKRNMMMCFDIFDDDVLKLKPTLIKTFTDFYSWNYLGEANSFLNEISPHSNAQNLLFESLKKQVEKYINEEQFATLPYDFNIDPNILRVRNKIQKEEYDKAMEKSKEESIFMKLFPETPILLGNRVAFPVINRNDGNEEPRETNMQSFDFKYTIPLDYYLNPIIYGKVVFDLLNGGYDETHN